MPKEADLETFFTQLLQRINEIEERERINRNKIDLLSNSLIKKDEKLNEEIRVLRENQKKLGDEIEKIKQKIDYILGEFPNLVRKEDLRVIERFIELWQPLKFATLEDVKRMLEAFKK